MKQNVGTIDRVVRILIALGFVVMYMGGHASGGTAALLGVLAAVIGLTAVLGFCPLYFPFKISTKRAADAA